MAAPRQPLNAATQSVGFTAKLVTVRSVSADGTQAVCVDRQNIQSTVTMLVQRSKAPLPRAGETWLLTQDLGMWSFAAIVATSAGQFAGEGIESGAVQMAGGQQVTISGTAPASPSAGDIWLSGASGNEVFSWSGTTWVPAQLGTQAIADKAVTAAKIATATITSSQISPVAGITAGQVSFRATDIGGSQILRGTSQPANPAPGDLWINPAQGNQVSEWDGSTWTPVQFGAPAILPGSLGIAQVDFTASDIGGITTSVGGIQPSSPAAGDLWFSAAEGYALLQWNGSAWVPYQFGTGAIAVRSITAALIAADTITARQIAAGTITGAEIAAEVELSAPVITGGTITGTTVSVSGTDGGLYVYDSSGNPVATIDGNLSVGYPGNMGIISWNPGVNTGFAALHGNALVLNASDTPAGQWTVGLAGGGDILALTGAPGFGAAAVQVNQAALVATAGTASNPTLITTDTWHSAIGLYVNGWTPFSSGVSDLLYRLEPGNRVSVQGRLKVPAGVASPSTICTLPAAYQPLNRTEPVAGCAVYSGSSAGVPVDITINTSGVFEVFGAIAGDTLEINGSFPLDCPAI